LPTHAKTHYSSAIEFPWGIDGIQACLFIRNGVDIGCGGHGLKDVEGGPLHVVQ
jgi:hypothetical protein